MKKIFLKKIKNEKERLEAKNELLENIRKSLTKEKIKELRDANEFEKFLKQQIHENDLKNLLREQEILALKNEFTQKKEQLDLTHKHILDRLELERWINLKKKMILEQKDLNSELIEKEINEDRKLMNWKIEREWDQHNHSIELKGKYRKYEEETIEDLISLGKKLGVYKEKGDIFEDVISTLLENTSFAEKDEKLLKMIAKKEITPGEVLALLKILSKEEKKNEKTYFEHFKKELIKRKSIFQSDLNLRIKHDDVYNGAGSVEIEVRNLSDEKIKDIFFYAKGNNVKTLESRSEFHLEPGQKRSVNLGFIPENIGEVNIELTLKYSTKSKKVKVAQCDSEIKFAYIPGFNICQKEFRPLKEGLYPPKTLYPNLNELEELSSALSGLLSGETFNPDDLKNWLEIYPADNEIKKAAGDLSENAWKEIDEPHKISVDKVLQNLNILAKLDSLKIEKIDKLKSNYSVLKRLQENLNDSLRKIYKTQGSLEILVRGDIFKDEDDFLADMVKLIEVKLCPNKKCKDVNFLKASECRNPDCGAKMKSIDRYPRQILILPTEHLKKENISVGKSELNDLILYGENNVFKDFIADYHFEVILDNSQIYIKNLTDLGIDYGENTLEKEKKIKLNGNKEFILSKNPRPNIDYATKVIFNEKEREIKTPFGAPEVREQMYIKEITFQDGFGIGSHIYIFDNIVCLDEEGLPSKNGMCFYWDKNSYWVWNQEYSSINIRTVNSLKATRIANRLAPVLNHDVIRIGKTNWLTILK